MGVPEGKDFSQELVVDEPTHLPELLAQRKGWISERGRISLSFEGVLNISQLVTGMEDHNAEADFFLFACILWKLGHLVVKSNGLE